MHNFKQVNLAQICDTITSRQFHQHFTYKFFVLTSFRQLFPRTRTRNVHVTRKKAAKMTFVQKTRTFNVDEIDHRCLRSISATS